MPSFWKFSVSFAKIKISEQYSVAVCSELIHKTKLGLAKTILDVYNYLAKADAIQLDSIQQNLI
ncbi:hypothetical protein LPB303_02490 [Polaribacter atrinae]|uniref:Uncharacterized protein n=1 Tax=Polaribacter atrinae TaxID=1333662 RepID=A0A176TEX0_9FLAO|nr:hypothetical protein LPB303_02490 [Polaribacter atrinae]